MSKIIKAHSLTGRITDGLMLESFKSVKRNRGAAGIDKVSIKMFEANLADNLRALERDLKNGSFWPLSAPDLRTVVSRGVLWLPPRTQLPSSPGAGYSYTTSKAIESYS